MLTSSEYREAAVPERGVDGTSSRWAGIRMDKRVIAACRSRAERISRAVLLDANGTVLEYLAITSDSEGMSICGGKSLNSN
jgi:hypothetical protein